MDTKANTRNQSGVTLLELLLGLLMSGIVVSAVAQFYVTQQYHMNQQMDVAEVQQNLRSAMQEMTEQLRMAGYGMPAQMDPIVASNTNPDTVQFFYRKSQTSEGLLVTDMVNPTDVLDLTGYDLSEFQDNTWAYIFDPTTTSGEFFYMSNVDVVAEEIGHSLMPLSKNYPSGSRVIAVEIYKYYLDIADAANPTLVRSRQGEGAVIFSEGIDSLNISYQLTNGVWTDAPVAGRLVRSIQITMGAIGRGDVDGPVKGDRHRLLTNRVNVRNLAM